MEQVLLIKTPIKNSTQNLPTDQPVSTLFYYTKINICVRGTERKY